MAALGDERLFALLEAEGDEIARGAASAVDDGAVAEVVERPPGRRSRWSRPTSVSSGAGVRIALNLGHTLGHALEAAADYQALLHGEAVAYGLRAAARIGRALDVTPPRRADRIEALLDGLGARRRARSPSPSPMSGAAIGDRQEARRRASFAGCCRRQTGSSSAPTCPPRSSTA